MGGPMGANDDLPWIEPVLALIREALRRDVPMLGHCLGAQLMARYEESCRRRGVTTILALVYDWNRDMHRVMRRKRYRNSGKLVEYIKKL